LLDEARTLSGTRPNRAYRWEKRQGRRTFGSNELLDRGRVRRDDLLRRQVGRLRILEGQVEQEAAPRYSRAGRRRGNLSSPAFDDDRDSVSTWKQVASETQLAHPAREYSWQNYDLGADLDLTSLAVSRDGRELWAIGTKGTALRSFDGGKSWAKQVLQADQHIGYGDLLSIFASRDGRAVWIIGKDGLILSSTDGGASWRHRHIPGVSYPWSITGTADGRALWLSANNATLMYSPDAGATWKPIQDSPRFYGIIGVHSVESGLLLFLIEAVPSYTSPLDRSSDKGKNWTPLKPLMQARSLAATDDGTEVWATSNVANSVDYSNNSGASWASIYFPTRVSAAPVSVRTNAAGDTIWVLCQRGELLVGKAVGHHAELAEARLVSMATRIYGAAPFALA